MNNHEHITQANEEANELWDKVPAWPVDESGKFLSDEAALVGVVLQVIDAIYPEPVAASK